MSTTRPVPVQTPPPAYQPPSRRSRRGLRIIGAVVGGLVLLGAGVGIGSAAGKTTTKIVTVNHTITRTVTVKVPGPTITKTIHVKVPGPTVTKTAGPPPPSATMPGAGTFVVGTAPGQWAPGTWQTSGPDGSNSAGCYWATLNDLTGGTNSIAANNLGQGPATFTVTSGLAGVQVDGCNTWNKIG
jgi:hypothetical protein